ncbi:MAG: hypothetical protein M1576_01345 [Deltaproteobacteria bacterium]|jgi:hypothetical protein|nr:hypothetical protein [Deltaproteobacteria bacterium]
MKKNYFIFTVVAMFFLTVSFMGTAFAKRSNQMTKKSMSYPYLLITQSSGVNHKGYCKFQIIYMPRILPNTTKISTIINHKVISGFFKPSGNCTAGLYRFTYNKSGLIDGAGLVYQFNGITTYLNK